MVGLVGSLASPRLARVDERGRVTIDGSAVTLDWWIGADDRWHRATEEVAVRQRRLDAAPVYETAMRIPGGDAVHRVYGVADPVPGVIVEVENDSPGPVALATVVRGLRAGTSLGRPRVTLDLHTDLLAVKPAAHAVAAADERALLTALERGAALEGPPTEMPRGAGVVALLQPVAHRTRTRYALVEPGGDGAEPSVHDLIAAPSADEAARGWAAVLDRGMRVVLADPERQLAVDRARADVLLEAGTRRAGAEAFAALEDWGFDAEARVVWQRLGWRARRRATRRSVARATAWGAVLRDARESLITETGAGEITLVPATVEPGMPIEVHDAPTRSGLVSFAVRWHGERPALLWDVRNRVGSLRLVAPGLDARWSTDDPAGEVLLRADPVEAAGA